MGKSSCSHLRSPKFSIFYNTFTRYELNQLALNWADTVEEEQNIHLQNTKQQLEYNILHEEYAFVKKRALANFLINERMNADRHITDRAVAMLQNIQRMEQNNLRDQLRKVVDESFTQLKG